VKIAFQGTAGAYSEIALRKFFTGKNYEAIGFDQSEQVIEALLEEEVDRAILPVENSIVGNVSVNIDLLYFEKVWAFGEVYIPIKHCLLAKPGVTLKDIKIASSHPIALAQCRDFLNRHHIQAKPEFDTAGASKLLNERGHKHEATIASSLCAEYYGLDIVQDHIQKVKNNITRFLAITRKKDCVTDIKEEKTCIAFMTKHHSGALLNCLQEFKKFNLNLTKLESRPIIDNPFAYIFFVDFLGASTDHNVQQCLLALKSDTDALKVIGSFEKGLLPEYK
jgi:prephenate dehydratase